MFYEDTVATAIPRVDGALLQRLTELLSGLVETLRVFDSRRGERERMRLFFLQNYGAEATIPLLDFYEDYYREIRVPEAEWAAQKSAGAGAAGAVAPEHQHDGSRPSDASGLDGDAETRFLRAPIRKREEEARIWFQGLEASIQSQLLGTCEEIHFARKDLLDLNEIVGFVSEKEDWESFGVTWQLLDGDNGRLSETPQAVINSLSVGYGKLLGRFLHMFDAGIVERARKWNAKAGTTALLAECTDASYFNANVHPPLMPYEVQMPGGHNRVPEARRIPVCELRISLGKRPDRLTLMHTRSEMPVWVFDLGFQNARGRSELFNLLSYFSPAPSVGTAPLVRAVTKICCSLLARERDGQRSAITVPRMVYEGLLILQRRAWLVPAETLPLPGTNDTSWEYFVRVDAWRRSLGMPPDVFVYIAGRRGIDSLPCGAVDRMGRDDYKPQYVGFRNPFAVTAFQKMVAKAAGYMRIEEMLPRPDQLQVPEGRVYASGTTPARVAEFLVHWYEDPTV